VKVSEALDRLVATARSRKPLAGGGTGAWTRDALAAGDALYANRNDRLTIDFTVERLAFPGIQTLDPRIVRIAPGRNNERHLHAHESLFVVLEGAGEVLVGERWTRVRKGEVAFIPRWVFHQTRNTSSTEPLVVLAVTDFGFTSAVLGDYDRRTRLSPGQEGEARQTRPFSPGEGL
jgi:mannose-6-phosphate isomerase-like protein (cupin superfamily)